MRRDRPAVTPRHGRRAFRLGDPDRGDGAEATGVPMFPRERAPRKDTRRDRGTEPVRAVGFAAPADPFGHAARDRATFFVQMTESPEDDWFSEPDVSPSPGRARQPVADEWLEGGDLRPRSAPPFDRRALADRRVLVAAGVFVAVLVAVLAATGVFGSGAPRTTTAAARPAARLPTTTLKPGDTSARVKVLQRALASLGYSAGAVDAQYGPATKQAVAAFQRAHGLTADGVFGPKTLQALRRALGR